MTGFAEGFRAGNAMVDSVFAERRRRLQDERAAQEFDWKRTDRQRADEDYARKGRYWTAEEADLAREPQGAPAQAGLVLQPQEGEFSGADASDALQGAAGVRAGVARGLPMPPVGAPQPAVPVRPGAEAGAIAGTATAPGPTQQAMPDVAAAPAPKLGNDRLAARRMREYAVSHRDPTALERSRVADKAAHIGEVTTRTMQMKEPEIDARMHSLNTNLSNYQIILTEKDEKTGNYKFKLTAPDGEPGKEISLNAVQRRQLVLAHELAQEGFGAEALTMLNGISKDLGEAFKAQNEAVYKTGTLNIHAGQLAAQKERYAAQGEHERRMEAKADRAYRSAEDRARAGDFEPLGISGDRKAIEMYDHKLNRRTRIEVPEGMNPDEMLKIMQSRRGGGSKAASTKPEEILPEGERRYVPQFGRPMKADGQHGWVEQDAPSSKERYTLLKNANVPDHLIKTLPVDPSGYYVIFDKEGYDLRDPKSLQQLAQWAQNKAVDERRGLEIATRTVHGNSAAPAAGITTPDPNYASNLASVRLRTDPSYRYPTPVAPEEPAAPRGPITGLQLPTDPNAYYFMGR